MHANFLLIGVGDRTQLKQTMLKLQESIIQIEGNEVYHEFIAANIEILPIQLNYIIDNKPCDVLIMFGDTEATIVISEAIKVLSDKLKISRELRTSIMCIRKKFGTPCNQLTCGIRNKMLIINMSNANVNAEILVEKRFILWQTIHLIQIGSGIITNPILHKEEESTEVKSVGQLTDRANLANVKDEIYYFKNFQTLKVEIDDAVKTMTSICKYINKNPIEIVNLYSAYGRILYNDLYARNNIPAFRSATKHGYAVLASDGVEKRIVIRKIPSVLESGTCIWLMNGESVPEGATAVVRTEDVRPIEVRENDIEIQKDEIEIMKKPFEGDNIKPIGYDIRAGTKIMSKGTRLGAAHIGLLALCGYKKIEVIRHPFIGILSIGDEIEEPGANLRPGHVYDSSRIILTSLLKENDFECTDFKIVPYNIKSIINKINDIIRDVDVLVTMGAANDQDILKPILRDYYKAHIYFGRVNIKPGKSTTFATSTISNKIKYFLCLSGNPASVSITARLFLLPLLHHMRLYQMPNMKILARIRSEYDLYVRPKYTWTTLRWNEKDIYANVVDRVNPNRNLFKYQGANALLCLPGRSQHVKSISSAYVTTLYTGLK